MGEKQAAMIAVEPGSGIEPGFSLAIKYSVFPSILVPTPVTTRPSRDIPVTRLRDCHSERSSPCCCRRSCKKTVPVSSVHRDAPKATFGLAAKPPIVLPSPEISKPWPVGNPSPISPVSSVHRVASTSNSPNMRTSALPEITAPSSDTSCASLLNRGSNAPSSVIPSASRCTVLDGRVVEFVQFFQREYDLRLKLK